jgi:hypothetical protein
MAEAENNAGPIDLTQVGGEGGSEQGPIEGVPYDPAPERESVRGQIAQSLVWTLVGVIAVVVVTAVVLTLWCLKSNECATAAHELNPMRQVVELVLPALVGLVGAVTGFYFGERSVRPS